MKRLAIVGTGIAGLGCAWLLQDRFDLSVFEQADYAGGHTNTVVVREGEREVPIDTGFMVFNHQTYPLLTRLFRELGVATKPTDMSFSVQHVPSGLEYEGSGLNGLFAQRRNLVRPRHWRMLRQIQRFGAEAVPALDDPQYAELTLAEYVRARGYGEDMLELYLVPMGGAVWSTPPAEMRQFPAMTLLRFWHNHGFLGLDTQHQWYTVTGGARSYVPKLTAGFRERITLQRPVQTVRRGTNDVQLSFADGTRETFDYVILACHGDQAFALLENPTELEERLLREFRYQRNTVTLHTDPQFMPATRRCWASWNYRVDAMSDGTLRPTTHYWMNRLQGVSEREDYFVSLNSHERVRPECVKKRIEYAHPLFTLGAIRAQQELPQLNQPGGLISYAGAWFRYGFHEDGLGSAVACARAFSGENLWS